jgi:tRNA splicing endonuclease
MSQTPPRNDPALIIVDAGLLEELQYKHRLPGTYVGVRRIRASSRVVQQKAFATAPRVVLPPVTFKVLAEDGVERRMTAAEKRAAKKERAQLYKAQVQLAKERQQLPEQEAAAATTTQPSERPNNEADGGTIAEPKDEQEQSSLILEDSLQSRVTAQLQQQQQQSDRYYYFHTAKAALEQELADLRGDRNSVPPVLLSPAQTHLLLHQSTPQPAPILDNDYAQTWATALRRSMQPAINTRKAEDMRAMVYDVVPQVWTRLRPVFDVEEPDLPAVEHRRTLTCAMRPPNGRNGDWPVLMRALHRGRGLHVGCGAKFGSDVLLYDGPRHSRHAFAGLRLVRPDEDALRAYDLAGYVRCLNTAGKLALLATVVDSQRVAIIDLALEKVETEDPPSVTQRRRRATKRAKTLEQRLELLDKTKQ